jgi:hypothetical protein
MGEITHPTARHPLLEIRDLRDGVGLGDEQDGTAISATTAGSSGERIGGRR